MWNKIGRIVTIITNRLGVAPSRALDLFYTSRTAERIHNADDYLYLMGDLYVAEELILELRQRQGVV